VPAPSSCGMPMPDTAIVGSATRRRSPDSCKGCRLVGFSRAGREAQGRNRRGLTL